MWSEEETRVMVNYLIKAGKHYGCWAAISKEIGNKDDGQPKRSPNQVNERWRTLTIAAERTDTDATQMQTMMRKICNPVPADILMHVREICQNCVWSEEETRVMVDYLIKAGKHRGCWAAISKEIGNKDDGQPKRSPNQVKDRWRDLTIAAECTDTGMMRNLVPADILMRVREIRQNCGNTTPRTASACIVPPPPPPPQDNDDEHTAVVAATAGATTAAAAANATAAGATAVAAAGPSSASAAASASPNICDVFKWGRLVMRDITNDCWRLLDAGDNALVVAVAKHPPKVRNCPTAEMREKLEKHARSDEACAFRESVASGEYSMEKLSRAGEHKAKVVGRGKYDETRHQADLSNDSDMLSSINGAYYDAEGESSKKKSLPAFPAHDDRPHIHNCEEIQAAVQAIGFGFEALRTRGMLAKVIAKTRSPACGYTAKAGQAAAFFGSEGTIALRYGDALACLRIYLCTAMTPREAENALCTKQYVHYCSAYAILTRCPVGEAFAMLAVARHPTVTSYARLSMVLGVSTLEALTSIEAIKNAQGRALALAAFSEAFKVREGLVDGKQAAATSITRYRGVSLVMRSRSYSAKYKGKKLGCRRDPAAAAALWDEAAAKDKSNLRNFPTEPHHVKAIPYERKASTLRGFMVQHQKKTGRTDIYAMFSLDIKGPRFEKLRQQHGTKYLVLGKVSSITEAALLHDAMLYKLGLEDVIEANFPRDLFGADELKRWQNDAEVKLLDKGAIASRDKQMAAKSAEAKRKANEAAQSKEFFAKRAKLVAASSNK